jgi:N,N'-diacetylbacillosaminyl-diphospho-undecaprenol alpha-1,3-N-acetylgalactosaminyltransferase
MRVALVLQDDFSMWQFRKGLIKALVARGVETLVVTPPGPYVALLESLGASHVPVAFTRFVSPAGDLRMLIALSRIFRRERPDLVHNMTIKPLIFGALAAYLAGVPRVVGLVSGLGFSLADGPGWRSRLLGRVIRTLCRIAGRITDRIWFQNPQDMAYFVEHGLIPPEKGVLIKSGGIDPIEFAPDAVTPAAAAALRSELGLSSADRVVLMVVARCVWSKGVREFVEASKRVCDSYRGARFVLVGPLDPESPEAVTAQYLSDNAGPCFQWVGQTSDVRPYLAIADVVALPSYYPEGVPRSLLEALAMARPIVTTDMPGCRETVSAGRNGLLVPARQVAALADAILTLLSNDEMRHYYGSESRRKVIAEFSEAQVVGNVLSQLYGIGLADGSVG